MLLDLRGYSLVERWGKVDSLELRLQRRFEPSSQSRLPPLGGQKVHPQITSSACYRSHFLGVWVRALKHADIPKALIKELEALQR